ncbi:MAG: hypothetical protein HQ591_04220 [candidate division Zixibacteria bacterium]|nr:hypothetical protein [Candidatus Tariuqbacter arcticus]
MTDYVSAFEQGLLAAEEADRTRKEIEKIFSDLDLQIKEKTAGKISISIEERERERSPNILSAFPMFEPKYKYHVISAHNPKIPESPVKILAEWTQDRRGYPCKIEWGGSVTSCEDGEALENTLAELLTDPIVGEKLYALMRLTED